MEFDKFYKSVQAAHLTLLSTKYKDTDVQATVENISVKGESVDAIKNTSTTFDHTEEVLASKHEKDDLGQDTDFDQEPGMIVF